MCYIYNCACLSLSLQADSAAHGQGERRDTGQRNGGPAGRVSGWNEKRDRQQNGIADVNQQTKTLLKTRWNKQIQQGSKYDTSSEVFPVQDLMSSQAQLMEVFQQKQKLEEMLRQRERELTALKGALKDEVANHDKDMEVLREQYNADMEKLRSNMEQVSQVWLAQHTLWITPQPFHLLLLCSLPVYPSASVAVSIKANWGNM